MPSMFDNTRRWIKDQFSKPDELIEGTPQQKIRETHDTLQGLTPDERARAVEHVQAYATYYHQGRHNEFVPPDTAREIYDLQRYSERLTRVDAAREILERYGGAPSQRTLAEALDRSHKEREGVTEPIREQTLEKLARIHVKSNQAGDPWMAQSGGAENLSSKHLASAHKSYSEWEYKDRYSFDNYVAYVQEKWSESPDRLKQEQREKQTVSESPRIKLS